MTIVDPAFIRARAAVSAIFFANGLIIGSWSILIPVVINHLSITTSHMGIIILIGGLGAIAALIASSALIQRFSIRVVILAAALIIVPSLLLLQASGNLIIATTLFLLMMASLAVQDVAMNANASSLEQEIGIPIMSAFHGFWSAGAMTGAVCGGFLIASIGSLGQSLLVVSIALGLSLFSYPHLEKLTEISSGEKTRKIAFPKNWLPWMLGLMAFVGFVSEGAVIDWSAYYFREELGGNIAISGFAFGGFSLSMMISRFVGDRLRKWLGDRKLFMISALIAGTGMLLATSTQSPLAASLGFFFAGFGNANIVPIAFSAAGAIPNLPKGLGIAVATLCGYAGLLCAPATLGFIGQNLGFKAVFILMAMFLLATIALTPILSSTRR